MTTDLVCPTCKRTHTQGCWTVSGHKPCANHLRQADQLAGYALGVTDGAASRQPEVAELQDEAAALTAQLADAHSQLVQDQNQIVDLEHQLDVAFHPVEVLLKLDLSKVPLGPLTAAGAGLIFGQQKPIATDAHWRFSSVVADPDGRRWLRWFSAKNTEGGAFGVNLAVALARRVEQATFDMVLRLSPGFQSGYGLKWPGPSGTIPGGTGTKAGSGNDPGDTDWSCRGMLLEPLTGNFNQPDGSKHRSLEPFEVFAYVYQKAKIEQQRSTAFVPKPGVPFRERKRLVMNTVGKADGVLQTWHGDEGQPLVKTRNDTAEQWRYRPDVPISHAFWSQHRGGANGDPRWAVPIDTWVDIADGYTVTTPA